MNEANGENDDDKTLFAAWAFGEGRWFPKMITRVAYKSSLSENGVLLDSHGHPCEDRLPDPIVGKIWQSSRSYLLADYYTIDLVKSTREQAVHKLLTTLKKSYEQLIMATPEESTKFCLAK